MDLKQLARQQKQLFWDIAESSLDQLSNEAIIERIVNYGDMKAFKSLVSNTDKDYLRNIVVSERHKRRQNYRQKALNFLEIYLKYN